MTNDQILKVLAMRAMEDEQNRFDGPEGAVLGSLAGSSLGVLAGTPGHMLGQRKIAQIDKMAMNEGMTGVAPRQVVKDRARPGARMAGGLIGALAGGALGAGTAELVKRESPAARLIAKIQTQNGRLNTQDAQLLQNMLTDSYSNISDYRN